MEGFDPTTMTYLATTTNLAQDSSPDAFTKMLMPGLDMVEQHSNFDAHTFAGCATLPQSLPSHYTYD